MAGEWLKFECSLPDKPETLAITVAMGWEDPDLTVGKLMRVFRWFDQQTIEGNAHGVTAALLDRLIGVTGFIKAMANVGWIVEIEGGLALHNFDRHNGQTAKERALTAKRVAKHKAITEGKTEDSPKGNGQSVSQALPKEEKKRKEKNIKTKAEARGSRLPSDWVPDDEDIAFCKKKRKDLDPIELGERFRDHWIAVAGSDGVKLNWKAAWRNWVRKERTANGTLPTAALASKPILPVEEYVPGLVAPRSEKPPGIGRLRDLTRKVVP
jgi:hypothetical protein